jgi:hypothetical protein
MATSPSGRPSWQRSKTFKFFASIKLAVVLLAVIIVASIIGTIYESSFDAKVARAYVYGAPWFNLWLLVLVANLTVSALSRWPWKKHHVAVPDHASRDHHAALRLADRANLGCRGHDHALQGRAAVEPLVDRRAPAACARYGRYHQGLRGRVH